MNYYILLCPKCKNFFIREVRLGNIQDKRIVCKRCSHSAMMVNKKDSLQQCNFKIIHKTDHSLTATELTKYYNKEQDKDSEKGFFTYVKRGDCLK